MTSLPYLDLCSGMGEFAYAAHPYFHPTSFCEIEPYPKRVLTKLYSPTPIHPNLKELNGKLFTSIPLITGGYPCQPYSISGHGSFVFDDRYLWPAMLRVIKDALPTWVVIENVTRFIEVELDLVQSDLEAIGFETQSFIIPACSKGARFRRRRLWLVAYNSSNRRQRDESKTFPKFDGLQGCANRRSTKDWIRESVLFEPKLCRSLTQSSNGNDRLHLIGESIFSETVREIFQLIRMADDK